MSNRKFVVAKDGTTLTLKEGRSNLWKLAIPAGLTPKAIEGAVAAMDLETTTETEALAALEAAIAKRGSVIPDDYRVQYGVDQNCGDDIAKRLKDATTAMGGKCDMAAVEAVAAKNGMADDFDRWVGRGLNNGMVRMNLGNKLRAKARKGEEVAI